MRVLITNNTLAKRAGTELYVRDVATALLARGHSPIAFSPALGDVAAELRARTVPVVDDLSALGEPPDVIHGHHHFETMIAALWFPSSPVVSFCHGWSPWQEMPPRFPTIRRYVAVDAACRDRVVLEHGIDPACVRIIPNFVDLDRFRPRAPLPEHPTRALVFSNYATETAMIAVVREACARRGIALDVAGQAAGRTTSSPETFLPSFDVVFGKARCALEALAVGAAVVLCDVPGLGPMVTSENFDRLRFMNFGVRTLSRPIEAGSIEAELDRYDSADALRVRQRVRAEAGLQSALDLLLGVYEEAIEEHAATPPVDVRDGLAAASRYLHGVSRLVKHYEHWRLEAERLAVELEHQRSMESDASLAAEIAAMRATATWRLREALRRVGWLRRLVEGTLRRIRRRSGGGA